MYQRAKYQPIERRTPVKHAVLGVVAVAGVVTIAAVAPKALSLLGYVFDERKKERFKSHYIRQVLQKMESRGFVRFGTNAQGQRVVKLTRKGEVELRRYELGEAEIVKPDKWDGKYHVLIFDIKERKRSIRDELRQWLKYLGFRPLQQSVWVYPYPCREVIVMLKSKFKLGKEVLYLVVDEIENDKWLKYDFGLI